MRSVLVVCLVGCAGSQHNSIRPAELERTVHDAGLTKLLAARGNPKAIAALLDAPIVFGGMWFTDPVCHARFGHAGPVEPAHHDALAKCIASLELAASPRKSYIPDLAIIDYGPGIEVEALFVPIKDEVKIKWLGFVSRVGDADIHPTLNPTAFEALRIKRLDHGVRAALDAERARYPKLKGHASQLKVCIDEQGRVTQVSPRFSSTALAHDLFVRHVKTWELKPFVVGDKPRPVCSVIRVAYPAIDRPDDALPYPPPAKYASAVVVSNVGLGTRIEGESNVPSDRLMRLQHEHGLQRIAGQFFFCVDERGVVSDVEILRSTRVPPIDEAYRALLRSWRFQPSGRPLCTFIRYELTTV